MTAQKSSPRGQNQRADVTLRTWSDDTNMAVVGAYAGDRRSAAAAILLLLASTNRKMTSMPKGRSLNGPIDCLVATMPSAY